MATIRFPRLQTGAKAGKPIVVGFYSDLCGPCKRQKAEVANLLAKETFADIVAFSADFSDEENFVEDFEVNRPTTLISFYGKRQVGRIEGEVRPYTLQIFLAITAGGDKAP